MYFDISEPIYNKDLNTGTILPIFKLDGNMPVLKDKFIILLKGSETRDATCLITIGDTSSYPADSVVNDLRKFSTSILLVGAMYIEKGRGSLR